VKYKFEAEDVIYLGEGRIRIRAKILDDKMWEEAEKGEIGMKIEGGEWKIEVKGKGEYIMKKDKHGCGKEYYRILGKRDNLKLVGCKKCGKVWESGAKYVNDIPDATWEELNTILGMYQYVELVKMVMEDG